MLRTSSFLALLIRAGTTVACATVGFQATRVATAQAATTPTGSVQTIGGTGEAGYVDAVKGSSQFNNPRALALYGTNLVVADFGNNVVRLLQIDSTRVSTLASVNRPVGLAVDSFTNLFVASAADNTIQRFDSFGNYRATYGPVSGAGEITALTIDTANQLYIAQRRGVVSRMGVTGNINAQYGVVDSSRDFRGVAVLSDASVAVSDAAAHVIWNFAGPGAPPRRLAGVVNSPGSTDGSGTAGKLNSPEQIAVGPNSSIVVADRGNHRVRVVSCTGQISTLFGIAPELWFSVASPEVFPGWWDSTAEFAEVRDPVGIAVSPAGIVYDTEVYYHLVRRGIDLNFPTCGIAAPTNQPIVAVLSPAGGVFQNGALVTISSSNNVAFGPDVRIAYTLNGNDPTLNDTLVPIINGTATLNLPGRVDLANLRVRIFNGSVAGPVVSGKATVNEPVSVLLSVNSGFYPNGVDVEITSADPAGFGSGVQIFYNLSQRDPSTNDTVVPIKAGVATIKLIGPVNLANLRVRAFNNGVPGPVTGGQSITLPLPGLTPSSGYFVTNTVLIITNKNDSEGYFPIGTKLYYTRDGGEPTQSSLEVPIVNGIGRLELIAPVNLESVKVRAFLGNNPGATVSGEPTSLVPNRITFGFESPAEASSDFVAAAGQRFYAPVTLTIAPGEKMYGLQFSILVTNLTGPPPSSNTFGQSFESMLMGPVENNRFRVIPPATFSHKVIHYDTQPIGSNVVSITNTVAMFSSLLITNDNLNLLGVGWLERYTETNLYNTLLHDLIRYSSAHDKLYDSSAGRVIPGGYSFVVPAEAKVGNTYKITIIRPSANGDGIGSDVFIEAPYGTDPNVKISAVETITVGERRYVVGDLAPFRWFNAGDFGNGSVLNNDLEQIHQTVIYGLNAPPEGSDFEDAIDSCCLDAQGTNRIFSVAYGNDTIINDVAFGDGRLNISDLYVTYRRSLDPSLDWYQRYWSNGVRRAEKIPNTFRGALTRASIRESTPSEPVTLNALSTTEPPSITFGAGSQMAVPGGVAAVQLYADVKGPYPVQAFLMNLRVELIDGGVPLQSSVWFLPDPAIGPPTFGGKASASGYGAAWVERVHPGLAGHSKIGTLYIAIPPNAKPTSAYRIRFDNYSGSPTGVGTLPATAQDGIIIMANRPNIGWNDGIPDQFRIQYFGTLGSLSSAAYADPDGDGFDNLTEYKLGSNPLDARDNLRVRASVGANHKVHLRFGSVVGQKYKVESSNTLLPGSWSLFQADILGTGSEIQLSGDSPAAQGYFRIKLQD